jgi:hypothetical protein
LAVNFMTIRRIVNAPLRFIRYIDQPGRELQERYDAMSEEEKAERRAWSNKLYWVYQAFPSPFAGKRPKDGP